MKWVHIYKRDLGALTAKIIVTCILTPDGRVQMTGDQDMITRLRRGVLIPAESRLVTLEDGEDFLQALRYEYRSINLAATDVQEGKEVDYPQSTV
jgi:hypothetical protein